MKAPLTRLSQTRRPVARLLHLSLRVLLVAAGLALAWLLATAEITRDGEPNCLHSAYRDPVTGRNAEKRCHADPVGNAGQGRLK